jgi:hypothetical protein
MLNPLALLALAAASSAAVHGPGIAQDGRAVPLEGATGSASDKPVTLAGPVAPARHADADFERVLTMLTGSFRAPPAGEEPALRLNTARIAVDGLDNAVYFEIAREDSPAEPFRQGVFHLYRRGAEARLRVLDFRASGDFLEMLAGLWAAPESIPPLDTRRLAANLDLVLSSDGDRVLGRTPHPYPTVDRGAVEVVSSMQLTSTYIGLHSAGLGPDGQEVWSAGSPAAPVRFERQGGPWFRAERRDDGLIVITLRPAAEGAEGLGEGGEAALHFSSWLTDGTRINTSRAPGRDAVRVRHPTQPKGLSDALIGIAVGERRKVVIPPALAYGAQGARNVIPPNATLVFETECMWVDNSNPQPAVPPMLPGHGR